ncbi:Protein Strawberry Notch 2 [Manis pentadactyla]|nr:Protein Strawberry Notch 2 [Manis pentadactyla]
MHFHKLPLFRSAPARTDTGSICSGLRYPTGTALPLASLHSAPRTSSDLNYCSLSMKLKFWDHHHSQCLLFCTYSSLLSSCQRGLSPGLLSPN